MLPEEVKIAFRLYKVHVVASARGHQFDYVC